MILSPHYKLSVSCMVSMYQSYPDTYHTWLPGRDPIDLLLYIEHTEILEYDSRTFIQIIEQELYKLRKIYESNKKY